jgi:hypothetical protein
VKISEFLDVLTAALSFDHRLAQRLRKEFEDHLQEAVAAEPSADPAEGERRAVANCGDPYALAAELAVIALARRTKKLAFGIVLALLGVLLSMKGHIAWYAAMKLGVPETLRSISAIVGATARYGYWVAVFVGATTWVYGSRHGWPADYLPGTYPRLVRRFCIIAGVTTLALLVCITADAVLTAIRLSRIGASMLFLVPIGSIGFEIACASALIFFIHELARRGISIARLPQT